MSDLEIKAKRDWADTYEREASRLREEADELEKRNTFAGRPEPSTFAWGGERLGPEGDPVGMASMTIGPWKHDVPANRRVIGIRVWSGGPGVGSSQEVWMPLYRGGIDNVIKALTEWSEYAKQFYREYDEEDQQGQGEDNPEEENPPLWCPACRKYHTVEDGSTYTATKERVASGEWTGVKPGMSELMRIARVVKAAQNIANHGIVTVDREASSFIEVEHERDEWYELLAAVGDYFNPAPAKEGDKRN